MREALKIITNKKLGVLIAINNKKKTSGIINDGQIRRTIQKNKNCKELLVKNFITSKPIKVKKEIMTTKTY